MDPKVLILMGSDSDWEVMSEAKKALDEMGVAVECHVSSAHRTPERTGKLAREAAGRGVQVIVCGAGAAGCSAVMIPRSPCRRAAAPPRRAARGARAASR